MEKIIKNSFGNFLKICIIFLIMTGWIFSGWPEVWQNPSIPPEIQEAEAASKGPYSPTTDKNSGDNWSSRNNAISDGSGASVTIDKNKEAIWWGFNFDVPNGDTIDGIEVICDAWTGTDGPDKAEIYLSWDGDLTYTAAIEQTWPLGEDTMMSGGSTNTWGRTWSTTEINSDNFRVKVKSVSFGKAAADWDLDWIRIKVYYSAASTLSLNLDSATKSLGNITPGTPVTSTTTATVTTNNSSGYSLKISDSVAGSDSALLHTDTVTRIADYAGTIATPTTWSGTGLGICAYAADINKEVKWGTGTTETDSNNKYAGISQTSAEIHNVGSSVTNDGTSIGYKLDVPSNRKTGVYSGDVTYTAVVNP